MADRHDTDNPTHQADAGKPHEDCTERIVELSHCAVDACGCGTVHLHFQGLSVRMNREAFKQVAYGFALASHRLDIADLKAAQRDDSHVAVDDAEAAMLSAITCAATAEA